MTSDDDGRDWIDARMDAIEESERLEGCFFGCLFVVMFVAVIVAALSGGMT